jgi:ubiquinone biosynthesis protein COQ9
MKSPLAEDQRAALIEGTLPDVAFDGWSRPAVRSAARRIGMPVDEALALFPNGASDLVACFSRWADTRMLDRLETTTLDPMRISDRIALAIVTRLEIVAPWREAVRRAFSVLALPKHAPLGLRLLYKTVDSIWYAVGDQATDFSFYTKRVTLMAIYTAVLLHWLEDSSPDFSDTRAFMERGLAGVASIGMGRRRFEEALERLPNPVRLLRQFR